jgi:hypothetical protein
MDITTLTLLAEPVFHQRFLCSDLGGEKVPGVQSLIHQGEEPPLRTEVFPFKLVELPGERSRLLNSTFSQINEWSVHLYLSHNVYPILSGR